jgi:hypothetical protein
VERRGGVAVVVPDQAPKGSLGGLLDDAPFESKTLERPVTLSGLGEGLMATELAMPRTRLRLAAPLASDSSGTPIVFAVRRGEGAVIVSGALDAWRYRDRNDAAFTRFWPAAVLQQASAVPPLLDVRARPALARPGDAVKVTVRLRETELPGDADRVVLPAVALRAVNPETGRETPIRLWPSAEPGAFEGEWRPAVPADYVLDAATEPFGMYGVAIVKIAADAVTPAEDIEALAIAAGATGGGVVAGDEALVAALSDRFPSRTVIRPTRPARSLWYAAVFGLLLSGEWALRRRRGLP